MTDIKGIQDGIKSESEKVLAELQTLRDEIRVKLHLAGAEGKQAWDKLESQLEQLEYRAGSAAGSAADELRNAGTELKASFQSFFKGLNKP